MALFTSEEDRRLPTLTQILQVQDGEENAFCEHLRKVGSVKPPMLSPLCDDEINEIREIRDLARAIMEQIADSGSIGATELAHLSESLNKYRTGISLSGPKNQNGLIPIEHITKNKEVFTRGKEFCAGTIKGLEKIIFESPTRVRRCAECRNPFQIQRDTGDNRFCSNRCSSRQRKRRQRVLKIPVKPRDILGGVLDIAVTNDYN